LDGPAELKGREIRGRDVENFQRFTA
jgi:hypothetical protein